MNPQINIIDYRNGRFQGFTKDELYHGLGAILTDDFIFGLTYWQDGIANGPSILIFPDEKIFYGEFYNDVAYGYCCYDMATQCQIYACFDKDGYLKGQLAAVFPLMDLVLSVGNYSEEGTRKFQEFSYNNENEKWQIVDYILNTRLSPELKNLREFLFVNFLKECPSILEEVKGSEYFFGFQEEGLGFKMTPFQKLKSVGFYSKNNVLSEVGKKIIIGQRQKLVEEGVFSVKGQTYEYSSIKERPLLIKKCIRDFFRGSLHFVNKFLNIRSFQEIQNLFNILNLKINDSKTERIAQELLQNPKDFITERIPQKISQPKTGQIQIDKIREEIERSRSIKKVAARQQSRYNDSDPVRRSEIGKIRNKSRSNPEYSTPPKEEKEKRSLLSENVRSQTPYISTNLGRKYQYKVDSPIHELSNSGAQQREEYYRSVKNPNKMETKFHELSKMYDELPQSKKGQRSNHRKYVYNDINEQYKDLTPTKITTTRNPRRSPSPYAPDRKKFVYFQKK